MCPRGTHFGHKEPQLERRLILALLTYPEVEVGAGQILLEHKCESHQRASSYKKAFKGLDGTLRNGVVPAQTQGGGGAKCCIPTSFHAKNIDAA